MRNIRTAMAATALLIAGNALAADDKPYALKESDPVIGSAIKKKRVTGSIPLNLRYEKMTPEQQAVVKSAYDDMPAEDEPPFPADGLETVMKGLMKASQKYNASGKIDLAVEVGPDGTARSVSAYALPDDEEFRQFAVRLVMITRYKPAVCGGKPCVMSWPLRMNIELEH